MVGFRWVGLVGNDFSKRRSDVRTRAAAFTVLLRDEGAERSLECGQRESHVTQFERQIRLSVETRNDFENLTRQMSKNLILTCPNLLKRRERFHTCVERLGRSEQGLSCVRFPLLLDITHRNPEL